MKPELHIVAQEDEPRTTNIERGPYRVIISEHIDRELVYVAVGNGTGDAAAFLEPGAALAMANALIAGAARALEHQFRRQLGNSHDTQGPSLRRGSPPLGD